MSNAHIILRIKAANFEIQLEGPREILLDMTEKDLPKIMEAVTKLAAAPHPAQAPSVAAAGAEATSTQATATVTDQVPTVSAGSCGDAILALMNTPWGRAKPRFLSEIQEALEANAMHYSGKVIGFTLTRLTRRQKLRRWKTEQGYVYTSLAPEATS